VSAPLAISRPAFRKAIVDYVVAFERVLNDPGSTVGVIAVSRIGVYRSGRLTWANATCTLLAKKPMSDSAFASELEFRHAVDVARGQGSMLWQLRASASLARLWRDQGKQEEARKLLAPVYGWFTEGFDTLDLREAKALLDELEQIPVDFTHSLHA
jgi:hypothetical protein